MTTIEQPEKESILTVSETTDAWVFCDGGNAVATIYKNGELYIHKDQTRKLTNDETFHRFLVVRGGYQ